MKTSHFAVATLVVALVSAGSAMAQDPLDALGRSTGLAYSADSLPGGAAAATKEAPDSALACDLGDEGEESFCPCWTIKAGALMLKRSRPEGAVLVTDSFTPGGTVLVDAGDFNFPWRGGFDVSLVRHNVRGSIWDLEARYFRVDGWEASVGTISSPGGAVVQYATPIGNTAFPSDVSASYGSHLDSFELNLSRPVGRGWLTVLGGFRFLELDERSLAITQDIGPGLNTAVYDNGAINDLYGFQLGANARLWDRGRLSVDYLVKAGAYDNRAVSRVLITQQAGPSFTCRARDNHAAFVGEMTLSAAYQVNEHMALRAGYQFLWLEGVATASGQIAVSDPANGTATVNTAGSPFYHGAMASLEISR